MPKHDDRHLTTIQLSALIDNQLPAQELAICRAHLQTCQQCQTALADLQQTVSLLQALPEPALPRSFALPGGVAYLQEQPARQEDTEQTAINAPASAPRRPTWQHYARRSLRAASAIAAVIGLFFLVSGLLPMLPHTGGGSTASTGATTQLQKNTSTFAPAATDTNRTATAAAKNAIHGAPPATTPARPEAGKTPAPAAHTPTGGVHNQDHSAAVQSQPSLPLPDLSTPLGQQEVGFTLFVLGIIGILLTRRKQKARQTPS